MASRPAPRVALATALAAGALLRGALLLAAALRSGLAPTELAWDLLDAASGLLLVWWLPQPVSRRLGARTAIALAWLLALVPPWIHGGLHTRLDATVALLCALAGVAFLRWWLCGSRPAGALYVVFAPLAACCRWQAWLFVLAPCLFAAGDLCVRPRTSARPKWRQIGPVVGGLAMTLSTVAAFRPELGALRAGPEPGAQALPWPSLLVVIGLAAAAGCAPLWRRERRLASFMLTLAAAQIVGTLLLPDGAADSALDRARGLLVTLPVLLLWTALVLARAGTRDPQATIER